MENQAGRRVRNWDWLEPLAEPRYLEIYSDDGIYPEDWGPERQESWSLERWEAGTKWIRKGPFLPWPWKVTPLHESWSPGRLRKSGLHPLSCLSQPASTKREWGWRATTQHRFNTITVEKRSWSHWDALRASSFQNREPSFQPLFFWIWGGYLSSHPSCRLYSPAEHNWHSCVTLYYTTPVFGCSGMDKEFQCWAWSAFKGVKTGRGATTVLSSRWLRLPCPVSPVYNNTLYRRPAKYRLIFGLRGRWSFVDQGRGNVTVMLSEVKLK